MKKKALFLAALAFCATAAFTSCNQPSQEAPSQNPAAQTAGAETHGIVYIDMDRILQEYDMANDLTAAVNAKAQSIEEDLNRRGSKIERDGKEFQDKINKGLMTQSSAEVQAQKLQEDQYNFQNYAARKNQEMQEEAVVTQNQILDAINTYLKKFNAEKKYSMIIATSGQNLSLPVACADTTLNITSEVIEGLNKEYVGQKNQKSK
ncbi:MAG: OmpH family outer membrane protein [Bacteroidales bacterium]|nr:OmpH family outer membrane protein [Bacteroidales bacterium]